MLKNIDIYKFTEEAKSTRWLLKNAHPASNAGEILKRYGARKFYRFHMDEEAYALPKPVAPVTPAGPRTLKEFEEDVRGAWISTPDMIRASKRQVALIISLARDLEDYRPIGGCTLNRNEAAQIISTFMSDIARLGDDELGPC